MAAVRHLGFFMTSYRTTHDLCLMVLTSSWNYTLIVFILSKISRFLYSTRLPWNCLFTPYFEEFWRILPPNEFRYCRNPQKDCPWAKTRRMSHNSWKIHPRVRPGRVPEKNIQHNELGKKEMHDPIDVPTESCLQCKSPLTISTGCNGKQTII